MIHVLGGLGLKDHDVRDLSNCHVLSLQFTTYTLILGTIPILRQQRDWVGGVRKMAYFADVQSY